MSSIPVARRTTRTVPSTRSAKEAENAIARPPTRTTTGRAKSALANTAGVKTTANGAALTHTRATSSTAASKAKTVLGAATAQKPTDDLKEGKPTVKRKREALVEVTGLANNNKAGGASAPSKGKDKVAGSKGVTVAVAAKAKTAVKATTKASSRTAGVPVARKPTVARATSESTSASRTDTETTTSKRSIIAVHDDRMEVDAPKELDEDENARAFKKRHTVVDNPPQPAKHVRDLSQEEADRIAAELQKDEPSTSNQLWDDLDADDWDDPVMVSEYVVDVCKYLKQIELETMPDPDYMRRQTEVTWEHRGVLIDWLLQVHARFSLLVESLYLTVNVLDRFLSVKPISLSKLQLVGLASFFIATKFEETYAPSVREIAFLSDNVYTVEEILKAEKYILRTLDYDLKAPGPMGWLRRGSKADDCEVRARTVAKYLTEIGCLERRLIKYVPSQIAAAALWLARLSLGREEWTPNLEHYTTYTEEELIPLGEIMLEYIITDPVPHDSLYKKYAHKKWFKCSSYMRHWALERWEENSDIRLDRDLPLIKDEIRERNAAGDPQ